ncbi:MAG TPA: phosphate ABC transporter substrate-binding protein [Anaerolineales bacterium]|nr:phosphate ABC transporter substrate-binding protein [Anaerolineales bacterium]
MRKNSMISFIPVLILALLVSSCGGGTQVPPTPSESPLIGRLTFAGSTTMQPLVAKLSDAFRQRHPQVIFEVAAGGSVVGIQAVHEGTADIGMASRALKAEEAQGIKVYTVGIDALAIVIHPDNPVESITLSQLLDIYMGRITNWKELGGNDLAIIPIQREISSGTRGAFDELALEKQEASAPALLTVITAGDVAASVAIQPAAIGYLGFGNLESDLKVIAIDGTLPSQESIRNGTYPLFRPLSLLTGPLSQPLADKFINFVLSPEGQAYVEEFGWIPVNK